MKYKKILNFSLLWKFLSVYMVPFLNVNIMAITCQTILNKNDFLVAFEETFEIVIL